MGSFTSSGIDSRSLLEVIVVEKKVIRIITVKQCSLSPHGTCIGHLCIHTNSKCNANRSDGMFPHIYVTIVAFCVQRPHAFWTPVTLLRSTSAVATTFLNFIW